MINLLPSETKKQLRAARNNTTLVRYVFTIFFATLFLGLLIAGSYYILQSSKNVADTAINNVQSGSGSYTPSTQKEAEFKSDLQIAKNIIDQQVSYSLILEEIAKILPSGTILQSPLELSKDSFNSQMTLKAYTKESTDGAIKTAFESSSVFTRYSLQSLNQSSDFANYPNLVTFSININGATKR